jgi:hypothetical protein
VPSAPLTILPEWSQPSRPTLGRDPLGLQATSVRVYRDLVPGLTNVTNRLRYYSFYCWVVRKYETTQHADDVKRWRIFIRRAEALFALTSEMHDPDGTGGVAGGDWARKYLKGKKEGPIDLRPHTDKPGDRAAKQYLLASGGNFGQFYVNSMTQVGLLQSTTGVPLVSRPRGQEVAEAFEDAVGSRVNHLIVHALASGRIAWADAKSIGRAVHPDEISGSSKEMRLLRDFVLVNVPDRTDGNSRRQSAWLLLDLLRRGITLDDEAAIRRVLYHRVLPDGTRYDVTGKTIDLWRVYQANELCHVALEVWLNAVADSIKTYRNGQTPIRILQDLIARTFDPRQIDRPWRQWATAVNRADIERQEELTDRILGALRDLSDVQKKSALQAAAELLAVLWVRWATGENGVREALLKYSGIGGRSLAHVLASLDTHAETPVRQCLIRVLQEHIVEGHLSIAGRKLAAASDKFTYRFMLSDGVLSDGTVTDYGYTNPRLRNLARFLRDARVCIDDSLTAAGSRFLDENKPS